MFELRRWVRDGAFLLTGALLSLGAVHFQQTSAHKPAPAPKDSSSSSAKIGMGAVRPEEDEPSATQLLRQARREDSNAWQSALAVYQSPSVDWANAASLMLKLDAKGLGKLAAGLVAEKDSKRFLNAIGDVFSRWGELDPVAALTLVGQLQQPYRVCALNATMHGFLKTQPAQACAYLAASDNETSNGLKEIRNRPWRNQQLTDAVGQWAEQDPVAAAQFYDRMPEAISDYVARDVAAAWVERNPVAAMNWATHLPAKVRQWALRGGLKALAEKDPSGALRYYNALPDTPERGNLALSVAEGWRSQSPQDAAQWAIGLESSNRNSQPAYAVISPWVQDDPATAIAWASSLPSESARTLAWPIIAGSMAQSSADEAERWIATLPVGTSRDGAISSYCQQADIGNDPAKRLGWAGQINTVQLRDYALVKILDKWLASQPQAARQWINQANLPSAVTDKLLPSQ